MNKSHDLFYVNANFEKQYFLYNGMGFHEFLKCCPIELNNILVTRGYLTGNYNRYWGLIAINNKEAISELLKEDIYNLGDFHWLDYNSEDNLINCTPEEQAEVLYFSHFWRPLKKPFFNRIDNNFAYFSHDDGWLCMLYCKNVLVFKDILANKIINTFASDKRRKVVHMTEDVKDRLFALVDKGLLIDFPNINTKNGCIRVNYFVIGKYEDVDDICNKCEQYKHRAKIKGIIEYKNKMWEIKALH